MTANQTTGAQPIWHASDKRPNVTGRWTWLTHPWLRRALLVILLTLLPGVVTGAAPTPQTVRLQALSTQAVDHVWRFEVWTVDALAEKALALVLQPAAGLSESEQVELVVAYVGRAQRLGYLEGEIERQQSLADMNDDAVNEAIPDVDASVLHEPTDVAALVEEVDVLRAEQAAARPAVEQIVQRQVSQELARVGLGAWGSERVLPPVQFTFTEPPKKLVTSERDTIGTVFAQMLEAETDLGEIEAIEAAIGAEQDLSAYVTRVGGLGAYPTMVVDRASLGWILSTVAHEWVHNYLSFAPLGVRYGYSSEIIMLNETVAEIVGNEIGEAVLQRHYPAFVPAVADLINVLPEARSGFWGDDTFDFRHEMRTTRLEVDRLLAAGKVEAAEAYMEARRQEFVANGYNLRVLNQAYFAFHGSYGGSAASSDPIGPKMEQLREQSAGVADFLHRVRPITSEAELDAALAERGVQ